MKYPHIIKPIKYSAAVNVLGLSTYFLILFSSFISSAHFSLSFLYFKYCYLYFTYTLIFFSIVYAHFLSLISFLFTLRYEQVISLEFAYYEIHVPYTGPSAFNIFYCLCAFCLIWI
jgi:hypothetical protein